MAPYKYKRKYKKKAKGKPLTPKQKLEVKSLIGHKIETKYFNAVVFNGGTLTTSAAMVAFGHSDTGSTSMPIVAGGSEAQRVGNVINPKRLLIRGYVEGGDNFNHIRLIVFRWMNETGSAAQQSPAIGDVIQLTDNNTGAAMAATFRVYAPLNYDHYASKNIHVCFDRVFKTSQSFTFDSAGVLKSAINQTSDTIKDFHAVISGRRLGTKAIVYPSNGLVTNAAYGGIYIMAVSDSAAIPNPAIGLVAQLEYTDA